MSKKKIHKKIAHHIKNTEINHDVSQGSIILGILIFSFFIIWNYLDLFNSFVFLFIKLGSVLLLINIYILYKQGKKFWFLIKNNYYDRHNWFRYTIYCLLAIILLIILIQLPSKEDLKNVKIEQIANLTKFNPIYLGSNNSFSEDFEEFGKNLSFNFNQEISEDCKRKAYNLIPNKIYFKQELNLNANNVEDVILFGSYDKSDVNEYYSLTWNDNSKPEFPWGFELKKGENKGENFNNYYATRDIEYLGNELSGSGEILGYNKFKVRIITKFNGNVKSNSFINLDKVAEFEIINKTITSCNFYSKDNENK